ncbi:MAG: prepilin peptidase [Planctomycetota bacterium]
MDLLISGWVGGVLAALLGAMVGSFANVVIYRSPRDGLNSFRPARSFCPACRVQIGWQDNVPVLSWLLLRGRCRACSTQISLRYPAVELFVAGLFVGAWRLNPPVDGEALGLLLVAWYLVSACVIVSLIDFEHFIIPDSITYPGMALGLAVAAVLPAQHWDHLGFRAESPHVSAVLAAVLGGLAGGGSLAAVGRLGNLLLKRRIQAAGVQDAMGWGDVKWMALAGTFLGAAHVLGAILFACFLGAAAGIVQLLLARLRRLESPAGLPFGPYLSAGILLEVALPGQTLRWLTALATPA